MTCIFLAFVLGIWPIFSGELALKLPGRVKDLPRFGNQVGGHW